MLFVSETFPGRAPTRTTVRPSPNAGRASTSRVRTTVSRFVTGTVGSTNCARPWWCSRSIPRHPRGPARRHRAPPGSRVRRTARQRERCARRGVDAGRPRRRLCRNDQSQRSRARGRLRVAVAGEPRWRRAAQADGEQGDYSSPKFTDDGRTLLAKVRPRSEQHVFVANAL